MKLPSVMYYLMLLFLCLQKIVCGELTLISNPICVCVGEVAVYQCITTGIFGGTTIYKATFFSCPGDQNKELSLSHSRSSIKVCNNRTITGQIIESIRVDNSTIRFISRLYVTVTPEIIGDTIECTNDDGVITEVGNSTIIDATDLFLSQDEKYTTVVGFGSKQLIFNWTSYASDCPAIQYNINASSSCGNCPTITNHAILTCTDVIIDGSICTIAIQPVYCQQVFGKWSTIISVSLDDTLCESNTEILPGFISGLAVILFLIFISFICFFIVLTKWVKLTRRNERLNLNHLTQARHSTLQTMRSTSYEEVTKVVDNMSMGTYGPLEYEEPIKTKGINNNIRDIDEQINLDNLLIKLQGQLDSQWYLYGLALGVSREFLEQLKKHSKEDCLIAVLDYWLHHHSDQPTWQEVVEAQKKLEFYNLAKNSL